VGQPQNNYKAVSGLAHPQGVEEFGILWIPLTIVDLEFEKRIFISENKIFIDEQTNNCKKNN
jgi:hypothetical protein